MADQEVTTVDGFRDLMYRALRRRLAVEVGEPEPGAGWVSAGLALVVVGVLLSGLLTWVLRDTARGRPLELGRPLGRPPATSAAGGAAVGPVDPDRGDGAGGPGGRPGPSGSDGASGSAQGSGAEALAAGVASPATERFGGTAPVVNGADGPVVAPGPGLTVPPAPAPPPGPGSPSTTGSSGTPAPPSTGVPTTAAPPARACLSLTGPTYVAEGSTASYALQFDRAVPVDVTYRVSVVPGTAGWVGPQPGLAAQDVMWGGYYTTWTFGPGLGWVATGRVDGRVATSTFNLTPTYTDRPMVGPAETSWDWSLVVGGVVQSHPWVDVTVPAGSLRSGELQVQVWKEQVTVDQRGVSSGYAEGWSGSG